MVTWADGAGHGGGIFNDDIATLRMVNCEISYNLCQAERPEGGGLHNSGTATLTNCTISNNRLLVSGTSNGGSGAGIKNLRLNNSAATLNLVNCTIVHNYFDPSTDASNNQRGGGIAKTFDAPVNLRNTIVALNRAVTGPDVYENFTPYNSQGHNLIGDTGDTTGWITDPTDPKHDQTGTNPLLADPGGDGSPEYNGGQTLTHALQPGSPAVDAGDDAVREEPFNLTTDQRGTGFPRQLRAHVDIGAYEVDQLQTGSSFVVNKLGDYGDGICGLSDCTLLDAIETANAGSNLNTISFAAGVTGTLRILRGGRVAHRPSR